jgi:tetratricopeptide (TPR) repeat protein
LATGLSIGSGGCGNRGQAGASGAGEDSTLQAYQRDLLDLAFEAASAMPLEPHVKNRSRAQEVVVLACFELNQPQRARRYIEGIVNWRRGTAYADLAFHLARNGLIDEVENDLERAAEIAEETEDWRRDRIKAKIARAYAYLGLTETAETFGQGIEASESGTLAQVRAMVCPADAFEGHIEKLETLASADNFDVVRGALAAYAELFKRFYADIEKRALTEQKIKASWDNMPPFVQIELLSQLAEYALDHDDRAKALELVNEAEALMDAATWRPRPQVPLMAGLAALRFRAGDEERGREEIQQALELFESKRNEIVNIYRAETLRPVAEAYQAMGQTASALEVYVRAVEAGMENPNSRPRAEDLTATCCSMAVHAVEPSANLWNRIREIRDGLGDPW